MGLTVIQLVTEFTDKMNLPTPSAVVGAADKSSKQYLAALKALIRDLGRNRWMQQRAQATITAVNVSLQGTFTELFGAGFLSLIKDTFWSVDKQLPVNGPLTPQAYQTLVQLGTNGPEYQYYVEGTSLYIIPAPATNEEFSVFFETAYGVLGSNGVFKALPESDEDTFIYPDEPMMLGFEYHWLRIKGEAYDDAFVDYMNSVAASKAAMTGPTLQLDSQPINRRPGIFIPPGNWAVS